ncbi:hypothetical protein Salat_2110300 [Sesamum alatum]|uniref:Uncharacterized protein n=1 Tax=Sesamum alatum TaxID=300844 RepID=A0AAE1Y156_9LAMI|nr:hypothetical protein Salat_2110300 [Sesamum alatum]
MNRAQRLKIFMAIQMIVVQVVFALYLFCAVARRREIRRSNRRFAVTRRYRLTHRIPNQMKHLRQIIEYSDTKYVDNLQNNDEFDNDTQDCYVPTAEWCPKTGYGGNDNGTVADAQGNVDVNVTSTASAKKIGSTGKKRKAKVFVQDDGLTAAVNTFCDSVITTKPRNGPRSIRR